MSSNLEQLMAAIVEEGIEERATPAATAKRLAKLLAELGLIESEGVTFCYVTYNKCAHACPTREECALGLDKVCAACGETRREHVTPGGRRYGPMTLCGAFIPQKLALASNAAAVIGEKREGGA